MTAITKEYLDSLDDETIMFIRDYIWYRFGKENGNSKKPAAKKNSKASFSSERKCPHCAGTHVIKWGFNNGKQRYKCKDCKTCFCDTTNTVLEYLHADKEKLMSVIEAEIRGDSLEEISNQADLPQSTCFYIRQRLHSAASIRMSERKLSGQIELDATYKKINLSGTKRENMPRASKKRGKKAPVTGEEKALTGPSHHKICIVTAVDEHDNILYHIAGLGMESISKYEQFVDRFSCDKGDIIISDKNRLIIAFAKKHGLKSDVVPVEENTKHYTTPLGNSLGDVNELHSVFKNEVRKYHGISTRHLIRLLSSVCSSSVDDTVFPVGVVVPFEGIISLLNLLSLTKV